MTKPFWDIFTDGVTQGSLATWMLCPQKAAFGMKEGLRHPPSGGLGPIEYGDFYHRCLDEIYGMARDNRLDEIGNVCDIVDITVDTVFLQDKQKLHDNVAKPSAFSDLSEMAEKVRVMLQCYFKKWTMDFSAFTWLDLERVFQVPYTMFHPAYGTRALEIPIRGKYDGVFLDSEGKHWLFETKTKSFVDDSLGDKLNYDLQIMLYMWTMKQTYGVYPAGVLYNVVRRPLLRLKAKESLQDFMGRIEEDMLDRMDHYFIRYTVSVTPQEIDRWADNDFTNMMNRYFEWSQKPLEYRNSGACNMWNRPCEYMSICAHGDRTGLVQKEFIYPELQPSAK